MYHHHQHQGKNINSSSRMVVHNERHLFLQGGHGDSGLMLSTDAKPRLKWTPDLHERFIEAVNQLGGADSKYTNVSTIAYVTGREFSSALYNFLMFYICCRGYT